jgi:hypothetical protein
VSTQHPPAGWFPDPNDAAQWRYWDGAQWTDHRAPRGQTTTDQINRAGQDLAEGLNRGLNAVGGWLQQTGSTPTHPTFASVAASCRDEGPRDPLSHPVDLVLLPTDLPGLVPLFAASTEVAPTPTGGTIEGTCRFVPNPWDPADPTGVAVLVGTVLVGRFPPGDAAAYCPPLAELASRHVLATGTVQVWAQGNGVVDSARVTARIGELGAYSR